MAKGNAAKEQITKLIIDALGDNFVCTQDKKIYTWADDDGEQVQIAISMTMPKTPIAGPTGESGSTDLGASSPQTFTATELSLEDKRRVEELMQRLGVK